MAISTVQRDKLNHMTPDFRENEIGTQLKRIYQSVTIAAGRVACLAADNIVITNADILATDRAYACINGSNGAGAPVLRVEVAAGQITIRFTGVTNVADFVVYEVKRTI